MGVTYAEAGYAWYHLWSSISLMMLESWVEAGGRCTSNSLRETRKGDGPEKHWYKFDIRDILKTMYNPALTALHGNIQEK
jgi:hypothetical protein